MMVGSWDGWIIGWFGASRGRGMETGGRHSRDTLGDRRPPLKGYTRRQAAYGGMETPPPPSLSGAVA